MDKSSIIKSADEPVIADHSVQTKSKSNLRALSQLGKPIEPDTDEYKTFIDPQSKHYLEEDLKRILDKRNMKYTANLLFSFNRFMHLYLVVTRHSKEMAIKESRKVIDARRRAYRLRNWAEYRRIIQHELDMEKLKYLDTLNFTMKYLDLARNAYTASYAKYASNISKLMQIKDARRQMLLAIENRQIDDTEFNEEMMDIPTV